MASIAQLMLGEEDASVWTNPSVYIMLFSFLILFVIQVGALWVKANMCSTPPQVNSLAEMFIVCFIGSCCVAVYITAVLYLGASNCTEFFECTIA